MLQDKDRGVRGRAAATLARLAESHPARLPRVLVQLREGLADESAYVRWHLVYAFGKIGSSFPAQFGEFLNDLVSRLDDENRVVGRVACKALSQIAIRKPLIIEDFFRTLKREMPSPIARVVRRSKSGIVK
jgi:hypothetical protein